MKIAGAPISWGVCEVPGWGHQLPAERVLREMREIGLTATEFGPDGFLPSDGILREIGLAAVGGFVPVVLHEGEPAVDLDRFVAAGADTVVLAAATGRDGYDTRPELDDASWKRVLTLSNLKPGEVVTILTASYSDELTFSCAAEAAVQLGAKVSRLDVSDAMSSGIGLSTDKFGYVGDTPLAGNSAAMAALTASDLVIDLMVLLFSQEQDFPEIGEIIPPACFQQQRDGFLQALEQAGGDVVMVSNEVGMGIVPQGAVSRWFVDEAGRLNQAVAARCERVFWVAAGLPLALKG